MTKLLSKKFSERTYLALIIIASLFFLVYEVLRALRASITIDEATTFLVYIKGGLLGLFNFNEANNHFLNTVLAKICVLIGGDREFILRLPNLMGYVLYLAFSFRLLRKFTGRTTAFLGFLLLNTNPYVLDFFSLCRGYGLSLAFLMASLYYFSLFLFRSIESEPEAERDLSLTRALGTAAIAVLCNFTMIDVYFGLLTIAALTLILLNKKNRIGHPAGRTDANPFPGRKSFLGLALLLVFFNLLVISQDWSLSERLYAPVTVRMPGLAAADVNDVVVKGFDQKRRERPFTYRNGEWSRGSEGFLTYLHFKIPAAALANVREIEIRIGDQTFRYISQELRSRLNGQKTLFLDTPPAMSMKKASLPLFKPAINWRGDVNHLLQIAYRFLWLVSFFALTTAVVYAAGRFFIRLKILSREAYWKLAIPTLALSGLVAYPFYMLKTNNEPIGGGQQGFFQDTWTSLVNGSFYERLYSPRQTLYVGLFGLLAVLLFAAAIYHYARKKELPKLLPGASFPALILLVYLFSIFQKVIFDNPYRLGRQALYFIPLSALFVIFSLRYLDVFGRAGQRMSLAILALITFVSVYNFSCTMNTVQTVDWRFDADTKPLMSDLPRIKAELDMKAPSLRLGVDWIFFPSLTYYQRRDPLPWLDFRSLDDRPENDLFYLHETFDPALMVLIKDYPVSGNILVRLKENVR